MKTTKYYQAAVLNKNSWSPVTGNSEVVRVCGHKHRTVLAAGQCLDRHDCECDYHFNGTVIDQDDCTLEACEAYEMLVINKK